MHKIDWASKFEEFLIENNCYSEFVINLLEYQNMTLSEYVKSEESPYRLIFSAFIWDKSIWAKLNSKWREYVNSIF